MEIHGAFASHFPGMTARQNGFPTSAEFPLLGVSATRPALDVDQERRFREAAVLIQLFKRIPWKEDLHRLAKHFFQSQIERTHSAMKINRAKQVRPRFNEVDQCWQTTVVDGESVSSEKTVVDQSRQIECSRVVARHVRIAEHKVHIVHGVDSAERAAEFS